MQTAVDNVSFAYHLVQPKLCQAMVHLTQTAVSATGPLSIVILSLLKCGRGLETGSMAVISAKPFAPGTANQRPFGGNIEPKQHWLIPTSPISFCFQRWNSNKSTLEAHLSVAVVPI